MSKTDKVDIMLVRNSELSTFRQCRQKWEWAYVDQLSTKKRRPALQFGSLIHLTLERFYPPGVRRNSKPHLLWEEVWKEYEESGGEDFDVVKEIPASELGHIMMTEYWKEYGKDDKFKILQPEQTFQIDVFDENGVYLATFTGTMDAVVQNRETRKIGLFEHKTGATLDPFGAPLIMDEQAGAYWTFGAMFLAAKGVIADPDDLDFVLYNRLRKATPDLRPKDTEGRALNKNGTVSKIQPVPLFKREYTWRTSEDRLSFYERALLICEEIDMARKGELAVYKNPDKHCGYCEFKDLCEVHETRSDWELMRDHAMTTWDPYGDHRDELSMTGEES